MTPPPTSRAEDIVKAWLLGSVDPLAEHQVKCLTGEIAKALEDYKTGAVEEAWIDFRLMLKAEQEKAREEGAASMRERLLIIVRRAMKDQDEYGLADGDYIIRESKGLPLVEREKEK